MRARIVLFLLVLFAWNHPAISAVEEGHNDRKLERETFALIDQYREADHLSSFAWSNEIAELARQHSRDMALGRVDFGHAGFGERMHLLRSKFVGMHAGGENVLMTTDPVNVARQAVTLWLSSPPHLHNIRSNFNLSAIGIWVSPEGKFYFTQIFVRADEADE